MNSGIAETHVEERVGAGQTAEKVKSIPHQFRECGGFDLARLRWAEEKRIEKRVGLTSPSRAGFLRDVKFPASLEGKGMDIRFLCLS